MVSWLFHCFKCGYNKRRHAGSRSSKNLAEVVPSPGTNYEIGNSYDDLYKVRGSHDYYYQSLGAACNSHLEEERYGDFHPSLCDASQGKTWKESRLGVIHINANETEEKRINCEPVDIRKKHLLLPDATKLPSDEVKYHRACHNVIHNKSAIDLDHMQCSPGILDGLLVESSTPSSRSQSYNKECSLEIKAISESKQAAFKYGSLNAGRFECDEVNSLNLECGVYDELIVEIDKGSGPMDKVEVAHQGHSPPWIINYKNPEVFEDLLLDHIDISCLIEDSVLISDWENSFTTLSSGKEGPNDDSIKEQHFPESKIALQKIELIKSSQCEMSEVDSSSASILDEFEFEHDMITLSFCTSEGDGEMIDSRDLSTSEMGFHNRTLSEHWICMDMEEMGNLAVSEGCFMPHINLSMRSWSNLRRVFPEHLLVENSTSINDHDFHELLPLQKQSFECEEELSLVPSPQLHLVGCKEDDSIVNCQFSELHSFNEEWVCDNFLEIPGRIDDMGLPSTCTSEEGIAHPTEIQHNNDVFNAFDHDCDFDHDHDHCCALENENSFAEQAKGLGEMLDYVYMESNVSPVKQENDNESSFAEEAICLEETLNYLYVESNESSFKQENCPTKKEVCCLGEPLLCVNMESNESQVMQENGIENGFTEEAVSLGEALDYGHVDSIESLVKQENVTVKGNEHVIENENENGKEDENENKIEVDIKNEIEIENCFIKERDSGKWQSRESMMMQDEAPLRDMRSMYGDDRPILGTVAAHWSPISVSTSKWWDGKGIPNSTYKYKEDQKVSWHAIPFEERLEKALAKQDYNKYGWGVAMP